ncbi:hypothetical protein LGN24_22685 [Burkholderia seminalis]|uniref:hypothetical protein n=1 Tax=Burkholderia TaxID=32008 RepID=UPI000F5A97D6|nr:MULTISPECIES: hypothetical protein [Burkholderia]MBN3738667.1 tyrosine-protein phosphatase [Burkholderia sp. Tr-20355]MCA8304294.1 hypothetical protein [Burkholderia seminalis]
MMHGPGRPFPHAALIERDDGRCVAHRHRAAGRREIDAPGEPSDCTPVDPARPALRRCARQEAAFDQVTASYDSMASYIEHGLQLDPAAQSTIRQQWPV